MKLYYLPVLIIAFSISLFQHPAFGSPASTEPKPLPVKGLITGIIVEADLHQPMEFASVAIYSEIDSLLVTGTISSSDGSFVLENIPFGKYYLVANFIGYEKTIRPGIQISRDNTKVDLGKLVLKLSSKNLEEVEIVADQAHVEYKIDRKVINVGQDINASTGTAADVLQNTPSVSVDIDGNVSLRGSSKIESAVNKPSIVMLFMISLW